MSDTRGHIVVMTIGDLSRITKVIKLSQSLCEAGYRVTRLGFKTSPDQPREESDAYGRILRIDGYAEAAIASSVTSPRNGQASASVQRERLKRILFGTTFGRTVRAAVLSYRQAKSERAQVAGFLSRSDRLTQHAISLAPDLVICSQFPALPGGFKAAKALGIPIVYDSRDLFCASNMRPSMNRRFSRLERRYIRRVDLVTTVTPQAAEYLAATYGIEMPTVLYNGSVTRAERPLPPASPVRVLFQGFFLEDRRLTDLITAMTLLRGRAVLTLQGWGDMEAELREQVDRLHLGDTVTFLPPVPPSEVSLAANGHDIGIVNFTARTENHRVAAPNKLFDYMGGGVAVAAISLPAARDIVNGSACGVLFDRGDYRDIAAALTDLTEDYDRLYEFKRNAWSSWERYSWQEQGRKLVTQVDRLLSK